MAKGSHESPAAVGATLLKQYEFMSDIIFNEQVVLAELVPLLEASDDTPTISDLLSSSSYAFLHARNGTLNTLIRQIERHQTRVDGALSRILLSYVKVLQENTSFLHEFPAALFQTVWNSLSIDVKGSTSTVFLKDWKKSRALATPWLRELPWSRPPRSHLLKLIDRMPSAVTALATLDNHIVTFDSKGNQRAFHRVGGAEPFRLASEQRSEDECVIGAKFLGGPSALVKLRLKEMSVETCTANVVRDVVIPGNRLLHPPIVATRGENFIVFNSDGFALSSLETLTNDWPPAMSRLNCASTVYDMALPDDETILLACGDGVLRFLDRTGRTKSVMDVAASSLFKICHCEFLQVAFVVTLDGFVAAVLLDSIELSWTTVLEYDRVCDLACDSQGKFLAVSLQERGVAILDAQTGCQLMRLDNVGLPVRSLGWTDRELILGDSTGRIFAIEMDSIPVNEQLPDAWPAKKRMADIKFAPSGEKLFVGFSNGDLEAYDLTGHGEPNLSLNAPTLHRHESPIESLLVSSSDELAVVLSNSTVARYTPDGEFVERIEAGGGFTFGPNGSFAYNDLGSIVSRLKIGEERWESRLTFRVPTVFYQCSESGVFYSHDRRTLIFEHGDIAITFPRAEQVIETVQPDTAFQHILVSFVSGAAEIWKKTDNVFQRIAEYRRTGYRIHKMSPHGSRAISGHSSGEYEVWDYVSRETVCSFRACGDIDFVGTSSEWMVADGSERILLCAFEKDAEIQLPNSIPISYAVSLSGEFLAYTSLAGLTVWSIDKETLVWSTRFANLSDILAVSNSGEQLAVAYVDSTGKKTIGYLGRDTKCTDLSVDRKIDSAEFSPDGRRLLISQPFSVEFFSLPEMTSILKLQRGGYRGARVCISQDLSELCYISVDSKLKICDGNQVRRIDANPSVLAFGADGELYYADSNTMSIKRVLPGCTEAEHLLSLEDVRPTAQESKRHGLWLRLAYDPIDKSVIAMTSESELVAFRGEKAPVYFKLKKVMPTVMYAVGGFVVGSAHVPKGRLLLHEIMLWTMSHDKNVWRPRVEEFFSYHGQDNYFVHSLDERIPTEYYPWMKAEHSLRPEESSNCEGFDLCYCTFHDVVELRSDAGTVLSQLNVRPDRLISWPKRFAWLAIENDMLRIFSLQNETTLTPEPDVERDSVNF